MIPVTKTPETPTPKGTRDTAGFAGHDHRILLLQGGGALGAYHAGVYEGIADARFSPDWVVGISVGAINAALIAGNPPERRTDRLREFWELVSARAPFTLPAGMDFARPMMNRMAAASAMFFGIPGFFVPRTPPPQLAAQGTLAALSYYFDGGVMSNTPLQYVAKDFRISALNIESIRSTFAEMLAKSPADLRSDPQVRKLQEISRRGRLTLIHLVNRHDTKSSDFKDYEFSRATVDELWLAGHDDVQKVLKHPDACRVTELGNGVRVFDL